MRLDRELALRQLPPDLFRRLLPVKYEVIMAVRSDGATHRAYARDVVPIHWRFGNILGGEFFPLIWWTLFAKFRNDTVVQNTRACFHDAGNVVKCRLPARL